MTDYQRSDLWLAAYGVFATVIGIIATLHLAARQNKLDARTLEEQKRLNALQGKLVQIEEDRHAHEVTQRQRNPLRLSRLRGRLMEVNLSESLVDKVTFAVTYLHVELDGRIHGHGGLRGGRRRLYQADALPSRESRLAIDVTSAARWYLVSLLAHLRNRIELPDRPVGAEVTFTVAYEYEHVDQGTTVFDVFKVRALVDVFPKSDSPIGGPPEVRKHAAVIEAYPVVDPIEFERAHDTFRVLEPYN